MKPQRLLLAAGLMGLSGVALGAFGAHGLKATLEAAGQLKSWEKAVFYQLIHAVALLAIALAGRPLPAAGKIGWCWIAGVTCFSGSLYCLALGGPIKLIWPVTPVGGLLLLGGWILVMVGAWRRPTV
jgi:uncharacterized membrane protein YgdD (TMEM256/DUF423 family)